jgi:hypothetical protein
MGMNFWLEQAEAAEAAPLATHLNAAESAGLSTGVAKIRGQVTDATCVRRSGRLLAAVWAVTTWKWAAPASRPQGALAPTHGR